ncbi:hypothetical protein BASA81_005633 [Batrachochytrium salamandrivorans]|nr:hypothetical protein BASA81_005633 [Batrachochytrium salamandrivorans]
MLAAGLAVAAVSGLYFGPWFPLSLREWWGFFRACPKLIPLKEDAVYQLTIVIPARHSESQEAVQRTVDALLHNSAFPANLHLVVVHQNAANVVIRFQGFGSGKVIPSPMGGEGRGCTLNEGVRRSDNSSLLLFCHADTKLPKQFDVLVANCLRNESVIMCAFEFGLDSTRWRHQFVAHAANFRSRFWWMPYGDQALAFRGPVFHSLGGFREDYQMMEDFDLVQRARSRCLLSNNQEQLVILPHSVQTSSRRWDERGIMKTTAWNWFFCAAYMYLHLSPKEIFKLYYSD